LICGASTSARAVYADGDICQVRILLSFHVAVLSLSW
jgi:hypothetical protein